MSPIDSDAGFSPILYARKKLAEAVANLPAKYNSPIISSQREAGSVRRHDVKENFLRTPSSGPGRNLLQEFAAESMNLSPLLEFGTNTMKTFQSLVQGRSQPHVPVGYESDKENSPDDKVNSPVIPVCASAQSSDKETRNKTLWRAAFLPKSSSFLKACRRSGRKGKVLVQGWVAFREASVSWKEIMRKPKRCDFRYIVLLDDKSMLCIFSSRTKQKKLMSKQDLFQDCISLDIRGSISISVVAKELGNEVCISHEKRHLYSLLPIQIPHNLFADKHSSRLARGEALKEVFLPFKRTVNFGLPLDIKLKEQNDARQREQNDVARHLLFVLDCAIKFPPNNGMQRRSLLDLNPPAPPLRSTFH